MRTGRPRTTVTLTADERRQLDSLAHRSRSAPDAARPVGRALQAHTEKALAARRLTSTQFADVQDLARAWAPRTRVSLQLRPR